MDGDNLRNSESNWDELSSLLEDIFNTDAATIQ
jgi:hypothetical protein